MAESATTAATDESIKIVDDALKDLCLNNATYFAADDTESGQRLTRAFNNIIQHVSQIEPIVLRISEVAPLYDYDDRTPANGFRSFLSVVNSAVTCSIQMSRRVCLKRDNILFRKSKIVREVESCNELLGTICLCLHHVLTLTKWCSNGELFVSAEHSPEELLSQTENINQCCFYGRSLGFQFCESMRTTLKFISLSMAVFSEVYYNNGSFLSKATNSVWTSGKYLLDPDTRARRIVNISQNADVDFCKAFWFLNESELMLHLPSLVSAAVAVSHVISIPTEPLHYVRSDGTSVAVPVPCAHVGAQPINVRLISHVAREGMMGVTHKAAGALAARASALVVHCHGGGFVAQSSRSHEIYLRDWAQQLAVPIVSVDYSLAPEAPFPRAIEEVFYAYCWAVQNCHLLGSTGETIILAGDSAGGNLLLGAAMKCVELGMRPPDGMFLAYVPMVVEFSVSPARLLCIMDPLLPFGFMMRCLRAYACTEPSSKHQANGISSPDTESFEEVSESDLLELQAHKSPISETSDTLTNVSLSSQPVSSGSKPSDLVTVAETDQVASQKYVSEFLEKYVLESDTDSDGAKIQVLHTADSNQTVASAGAASSSADLTFQQRFTGFVGALTDRLTTWKNKKRISRAEMFLDSDRQKSLVDEFKFSVPRDPYLSPYFATDDVLRCLPPIRILTVELDPCLDDCVSFAKKLKHLGNNVGLDVLAGMPHGFLSFAAISKEAHQGSKVCVQRITDLLNLAAERRTSADNN